MTTIAQAQREVDRLKLYLSTLDERFDAIEVTCPTVVIGKGSTSLQVSMLNLSAFSGPAELEDLPAEGEERASKASEAIQQVTAQVALIRVCMEHIKTGAPIQDSSGLAMCARIVRTGNLNGESAEVAAVVKALEANVELAERKLEVLKDKKFRTSNAMSIALVKNRVRYLTSLLQLSKQTPSSVLDQEVVAAAIKLGNKELDELHARLNHYYAKNGPAS